MTAYHLAQYNIAWLVAPLDDPRLADFNANLERVNLLAEQSPGFVWRYKDDSGNSTETRVRDDERILVNFSVWESAEALFEYAFHSGHADMYRRRREWFTHEDEPYAVLWWIPAGSIPTVAEGEAKLAELKANGPTASAFTFKSRFPPPQAGTSSTQSSVSG